MVKTLQDRLMTILKKLGSTGFLHLFGSSVINKILVFISSVVIVRLIPKADYGVYSNANNILNFFCLAEGFATTTVLLQFGCTTKGKEKENVIRFCFTLSLVTNTILSIAILISGAVVPFAIAGTGSLLTLMSFQPLIRTLIEQQRIYLRIEQRNKEFAFSNNIYTATHVVLTIVFSLIFKVNGLIFSNYLTVVIITIFLWKRYGLGAPKLLLKYPKEKLIKLLKFSFVCIVNNSTASIMYILDTFVLGIVIAQSTVTASYKVASTIPSALSFIPTCVMIYIYPYFAKRNTDIKWCLKTYKKVLLFFGGFNLVMVTGLIVFSKLIIRLVFGAQYLDAVPCFIVLCIGYFIRATFRTVPGQLLITQEKLGFNTATGFISGALNTILNIILIPKYSAMGAALATVIVTALVAVAATIYLFMVYYKALKHPELVRSNSLEGLGTDEEEAEPESKEIAGDFQEDVWDGFDEELLDPDEAEAEAVDTEDEMLSQEIISHLNKEEAGEDTDNEIADT